MFDKQTLVLTKVAAAYSKNRYSSLRLSQQVNDG